MAVDGAAAHRRGRPRRRHPVAPRRSGRRRATWPTSPIPLVDCRHCGARHRQDKLDDPDVCPTCGSRGSFTEPRAVQPDVQDPRRPGGGVGGGGLSAARDGPGHVHQLRQRAQHVSRKKPPFGIAQVGKRSATRSRPATSCSAPASSSRWRWSSSCRPAEAEQWYEYWCQQRHQWYIDHGIARDKLRLRAHDADELSHYSSGTSDVEFLFPWGWDELEGIANRGDYDLTQHADALGSEPRVLRPGDRRALRAPRDRAGGRRHPHR